jgi:hypothetical protein
MGTLIDRFEEHDGPVRGIDFHKTQRMMPRISRPRRGLTLCSSAIRLWVCLPTTVRQSYEYADG